MRRRQALAVVALVLAGACTRRQPDDTPEGAVREWIERMRRVQGEPEAAQAALELLAKESRDNLQERATRASAATGRKIGPEDMIVPSRFSLRFEPRHMNARVAGDRAIVEVVGAEPEIERAEVPCVREAGKWRVQLILPPLPALEKRPDAGV